MIVKVYGTLWLALLLISAILYVAGSFTLTVALTMQFIAFGMVFMGMIGVLPALVSHPAPDKTAPTKSTAADAAAPSPLGAAKHALHA